MKKTILFTIAIIGVLSLSLTSCTKEGNYTCHCTYKDGNEITTKDFPEENTDWIGALESCTIQQTLDRAVYSKLEVNCGL